MPRFKSLELKHEELEQNIENTMELGDEYLDNRQRYEAMYKSIERSNMDIDEKRELLEGLREYLEMLQEAYEENIEAVMEENEEERTEVLEAVQSNLEAAQESAQQMDAFQTQAGVDSASYDRAKAENEKNISSYERLREEAVSQQKASLERLKNQRDGVMRSFFRG